MIWIDDTNDEHAIRQPIGMSRGRVPRDYEKVPLCSQPGAAPFSFPLIPRAEWPDRIADMERTKSSLVDVYRDSGIPPLDQNGTNYCWCNAVVSAIHIVRAWNNLPYIPLSPASVAAPIKGYRNQGGWGGEALEYIVANGIAPQSLWPANAIDRRYDNEQSRAARADHKVAEFEDMEPNNQEQLMTALFNRVPVPVGINRWSHEILALAPAMKGKKFGYWILNSWGEWEDHGLAVLDLDWGDPDDQCGVRVVSATAA